MKILFIQLPLVDHSHGYINGNIDYAPAVISSFIKKNYNEISCITLPFVLSNFCSDEIIIKYTVSVSPDIICFTSYLWNVERNLRLSKILREKFDSVLIFFGGPEISEGSIALEDSFPEVDIFISGEGEWFFESFFSGKDINYVEVNGNTVAVQKNSELVSVGNIVEPLSSNRLDTLIDGSVFIELTRGCPYKCSYCFYSKNQKKVRELPFTILTEIIKKRTYINEIYILCPTFDRSKEFISNLKILKSLNHKIKLHTEIRTDRITPEIADMMFDAGFHSLEVGLQSMNIRALEKIQRDSDPEKELAGMENLVDAGIDLKIGIIPGLPGDDEKSFMHTVDVLCERGLGDFIELYPLMILPGTAIREKAVKDGVRFQQKPPYYFIEGWNFNAEQIKKISSYIEERSGMTPVVFYLPDFIEDKNSLFTRGLVFKGNDEWPVKKIKSDVDTIVADMHVIEAGTDIFYQEIKNFIKEADVSRLYNVVIFSDTILDDRTISNTVKASEVDNFYRRQNVFNSFAAGSIFHLYQVFDIMERYIDSINSYNFIVSVFRVKKDSISQIIKNDFNDIPLLIEENVYGIIKDFLIKEYKDNPEYVAFINEKDMQDFYNDIGIEAVKLPFNFGIKKV